MRNGSISLLYGYTLQIYVDPGCEGQLCISQINYPKSDDVCYDFDNDFNIKALILDNCDNVIKDREMPYPYLVDLDEIIKFYVKITKDDPTIEFPQAIEGRVLSCGHEYSDIFVYNRYEDEDSVIYKSHYDIKARDFTEFCNGGSLIFEIKWGKTARYTIYTNEVRFRIEDVIFSNDLPIYSGSSNPVVCYPFGEFLTFGTEVEVMLDEWPNTVSCDALPATVTGYSPGIEPVVMDGSLLGDDFITSQTQTSYQIDDHFREEVLDFDFTVSVLYGPERTVLAGEDQIKVYHGFLANELLSTPAKAPGEPELRIDWSDIPGEMSVAVRSTTYPFLIAPQEGIEYNWFVSEADPTPGNGYYMIDHQQPYNTNVFYPTEPGWVNLKYAVLYNGGYMEVESPEFRVFIAPRLTIEFFMPNLQYVFQSSQVDICMYGETLPAYLGDDIVWSIEDMPAELYYFDPENSGNAVTLKFTSMPADNNLFGPNRITARLEDYDIEVEGVVKLFYLKYTMSHPDPLQGETPNWLYYWPQGAVPDLGNPLIRYDDYMMDAAGRYDWNGNHNNIGVESIWMGPLASDKSMDYATLPGLEFDFVVKTGIDFAAETVQHELFHKWVYDKWNMGGEWYYLNDGNLHPAMSDPGGDRRIPGIDSDGDMLPDYWENELTNFNGVEIHLDPYNSDTYDIHTRLFVNALGPLYLPEYKPTGDQELLAFIKSSEYYGVPEHDWSAGEYARNWIPPTPPEE
jgi:hypothetical protein